MRTKKLIALLICGMAVVALLVTGTLGDHHASIMSARMGIQNDIVSDLAPLCGIVASLLKSGIPLHGMRDITRGGLATVLSEIADRQGLAALLREQDLPINPQVQGLCDILGLDPLYMGNEGNLLLAVPQDQAGRALDCIRRAPYGQNAALVGSLDVGSGVLLRTRIGGLRKLRPLAGESLPRIC